MSRAARSQAGYILISVLVALVLLAVVAERLDARVAAWRDGQGAWQGWAEDQSELAAARDELLFAMVTTQISPAGFGRGTRVLRVDGRPYRLPSGVFVSVQDSRGLIPVVEGDETVMRRFLLSRGMTDRDVEPLLDMLADYSDTDDRHRLNGMERDGYARLGLPPPRNDWPVSVYELRQVAGWATRPALWLQASDFFTPNRDGLINPNTAPAEVLLALPGAKPAGVRKAIERREKRLFSGAADLLSATGILVEDDPVAFNPGRFYRLRVWKENGPGAIEYQMMLTPAAPQKPWLILETRLVERPVVAEPSAVPDLPLATAGVAPGLLQ